MTIKNNTFLCRVNEISDPGAHGFKADLDGQEVEGFVVQRDTVLFAYRNACPHTGVTLDWVEHQFLDIDQTLIQCAVHDARFLIDTGECVLGPCIGESLQKLDIVVLDGCIYLQA